MADSREVLRRVIAKSLVREEDLGDDEKVSAERAGKEFGIELHLADMGTLGYLCGTTPAELAKSVLTPLVALQARKPCGCPSCKNRHISN